MAGGHHPSPSGILLFTGVDGIFLNLTPLIIAVAVRIIVSIITRATTVVTITTRHHR
jgi:hypothetical protein